MLEVKNLHYQIGKNSVLRGMNLSIQPGCFYALAGANGAGKTTLIKITLDLIRNIQQGDITIGSIDHKLMSAHDLVTYLPENFDIKKDVTGWQFIKFVYGAYSQPLNRNRVELLCERLGLDYSCLDDKTNSYSKGMKQKLGLISCFMLDKPLIILDEPLSGLDPKARYHFKELLKSQRENNRTIFYSTHMLADAEEICDQFGILHDGKIVFDGSPDSCLEQYKAQTLEQAYMNCITGYPEN
ncbi:MAG: ABC transporter ATP-binding protein [Gammaproteobacteria bacterium]|nr:ABC transporter ATP-binding protein [Gammaproteobacteria bacterium]